MTKPRNRWSASRCVRLDDALTMPPLKHKHGETFDWSSSEVCNWLMAQPRVRQYVFDKCNQRGLIVYNPDTGTWSGKDYKLGTTPKKWEFA